MSCKDCIFFEPNKVLASETGECHYDSPKVVPVAEDPHYYVHTEWPEVDPEDWCGKYQPTEAHLNEFDLIEALAAYAHDTWSGWMKYQVGKCSEVTPGSVVPRIVWEPDLMTRWYRQMHTQYKDLPESEKESDRKEARRILEVVRLHADVFPGVKVKETHNG